MTFSCSAVSGNRSWKASIAVATCDLPMKPWGHCVHVTKSASTRRRCGRASKPDAAVAELAKLAQLTSANLFGCHKITNPAKQTLRDRGVKVK